MIVRVWRGWTSEQDADEYQRHFREEVLPDLREVPGHVGATLLRRDVSTEVEFVAITRFTSMDAVRAFAGSDPEKAVVAPRARRLLRRFDDRVTLYVAVAGS